tara:strand:+ start:2583 stop:2885 length:303 start_codon:yes stop_codon:yes gene_type:complete
MTKQKKNDYQVVVFITEWCPHCQSMRNNTWPDEAVVDAVKPYHGEGPAFIDLSAAQNRHLVQEFQIDRYPTIVIMDEERNIQKRANNMQAEKLVEFLEDF